MQEAIRAAAVAQRRGDGDFSRLYGRLCQRAARLLGDHERGSLTPAILVHEAWLRLEAVLDRPMSTQHLFHLVARAMRQVMIDQARQRHYRKRDVRREVPLEAAYAACDAREAPARYGDAAARAPPHDGGSDAAMIESASVNRLAVAQALQRLRRADHGLADVVRLHVFGGWGLPEIARMRRVSLSTIERSWRDARAQLRGYLQ